MSITEFAADEIVSRANVNSRITQANAYFPVSIADGGTGGTSATNARTNLGVMTETALYYNVDGTSNTIALSDSVANYSKIIIYYYTDPSKANASSVEFDAATGSVLLHSARISDDRTQCFVKSVKITCNGSTITFSNGSQAIVKASGTTFSSDTSIKIYKVIGCRY